MSIMLDVFLAILERDGVLSPSALETVTADQERTRHGLKAEQAEDDAEAGQAEVLTDPSQIEMLP